MNVTAKCNLTLRDHALFDTLTRRVRVLTLSQVGRTWYATTNAPCQHAGRRMRRLEAAGFIERFWMFARPEIQLPGPQQVWRPGDVAPDLRQLARALQRRWTAPAARTPMVIATRRAGIMLGGCGGRRPRATEATHDVCMAGVYLTIVERSPSVREAWVSEQQLRRLGYGDGTCLPDAMVVLGDSRKVIEFGGAYSHAKLAHFHRFCVESALAYEIW